MCINNTCNQSELHKIKPRLIYYWENVYICHKAEVENKMANACENIKTYKAEPTGALESSIEEEE